MKTEALAPCRGLVFYGKKKVWEGVIADNNKVNFVRLCMISY